MLTGSETREEDAVLQLRALPNDLLLRCLRFLDHVALCRLSPACSSFNHLAGDSELWRRLFAKAVPCRTSFDTTPLWRQLLRLVTSQWCRESSHESGTAVEKCWLNVTCHSLEVPVPYSSNQAAGHLLISLVALFRPHQEFHTAVLRRFERQVPGAILAEISHDDYRSVPLASLRDTLCPFSAAPLGLSHPAQTFRKQHNIPQIADVELCFGNGEDLRKEGSAGMLLLNVWSEESMRASSPRQVWVKRESKLGAVREELGAVTGIAPAFQRLFTLRSHHDSLDADEPSRLGAAEAGGSAREIWLEGLAAHEAAAAEEAEVGRELMWSSGEHVVVRDRRRSCERDLEAAAHARFEEQAASQPRLESQADGEGFGRVRVWVNVPETSDFSVAVWLQPQQRVAELRSLIRREARLALPLHWAGGFALWLGGREALDEERCWDLGMLWGGPERRVTVAPPGHWAAGEGAVHPAGLGGAERLTEQELMEAVAQGGRRGGVDQRVWGSGPPEGLTHWEWMEGEAELLCQRQALRGEVLREVQPRFGAEDCIRQIEWCPHAPGVMLAGSCMAQVAALAWREGGGGCGLWESGEPVAVEGEGEVLALQWLRRRPDLVLAGSLDVQTGEGLVELLQWEGGSELRRGGGGESRGVGEMGMLNSCCTSASDELLLLAGGDRLRFVDLGSGKVVREVGSREWHSALVNCPRFSGAHPALVATAALDKTCCLWDLRASFSRPLFRRTLPSPASLLQFSPADDLLLVSGLDNSVLELSAVDGSLHCEVELETLPDPHNFTRAYYTADGRLVASVSRLQDEVRLHHAQGGTMAALLRLRDRKPRPAPHPLTRSCRPDPFNPYRFALLADGMQVPMEGRGGDSTVGYTFDLSSPYTPPS